MKIDRKELSEYAYFGVLFSFIFCGVGRYMVFSSVKETEGTSELFLEGYMRVIAAGLVAYFFSLFICQFCEYAC
jgi:hypothetical protein